MSGRNQKQRKYQGARNRNLKSALINFILTEFPNFGGPKTVGFFVDELMKMLDNLLITKDKLQVGQMLWYALDKNTRITSKYPKFKPIILTVVAAGDIEAHCQNVSQRKIASKVIARLCKEAYKQGTVLSMRDLSLIYCRSTGYISEMRIDYEEKNQVVLPHQGSEHDMGSTTTHKAIIVRKAVKEQKDPLDVAKETNHSQRAVDIYLKDFYRVKWCLENHRTLNETCIITGLSPNLVKQYWELASDNNQST